MLRLLPCDTIPTATAIVDINKDICPFYQTVNLSNYDIYENGSSSYRGIIIPSEKQKFYDYVLEYRHARRSVSAHLRGCVCEKRPCLKLCCDESKYFNDTGPKNGVCENLKPEMNINWNLLIHLHNGRQKTVNVFEHFATQVGLPCDNAESLHGSVNEWKLQEDGIIYYPMDDSLHDTLDYCYSPRWNNKTKNYKLTPFSCPKPIIAGWRLYLNTYAMAVSVAFFIPTIVVYLVLKELRGNLCGKLLICYLTSLSIGYSIISFINISRLHFNFINCSLIGYTCYFFFIAAYFWLSAICFDIWMNFKENCVEFNFNKNNKQFMFYSLYVWLCAGLATMIVILVQISENIDELYKPGIGIEMCWLNTEKWSAAIYFYGPNLIILILNFMTFAHLTIKIYRVRRDITRMTNRERCAQENAIIILRLFLIMGISWLADTLSYCLRSFEKSENIIIKYFFVFADFANAIQGILIFWLFIMKPSVLKLLKRKFQRVNIHKPQRSISTLTTTFSRFRSTSAVATP